MNKREIISPHNLDLKGLKGNQLKDLIQNDCVEHAEVVKNIVFEITTGFGKTNIAMIYIKRNMSKVIHVIVPKEKLKQQWEDKLREKNLINYCKVYVINTYTMYRDKVEDHNPDVVIIDEGHRCLNEESEYFSTLLDLTEDAKRIILSASLSDKHKEFLDHKEIKFYYEVTKYWAYNQGLVPFHTPMNVPIDLTLEEMSEYLKYTDTINSSSKWLAIGHIYSAYETNPNLINRCASIQGVKDGVVYGLLKKWKGGINRRKRILYNAENKKSVALEILHLIDEKCLIFCKSIEFADNMVSNDNLGTIYHSKLKVKEKSDSMNNFIADIKPHLYSIDTLKEGFDIVDCRFVLRTAYESNERDTTQITGRVGRFDENNLDKESFLINFYVRSFQARGQLVESQELKWLLSNQKLEHNVIWFDNSVDVINYIQQVVNK